MANGVLGAETSGRVGQDGVALEVQEVEDIAAFLINQALAADSDGGHFAAAGRQTSAHLVITRILAGAGDEPATKCERADSQRFIGRCFLNRSASAHQGNDLYVVTGPQAMFVMARQGYDLAIDLYGDAAAIVTQVVKQLRQGHRTGERADFSVYREFEHSRSLKLRPRLR